MKNRLTLATSLAFNAGVLVTLACSHGGEAVSALADTLGDTVAAAIRAADVTFDDATTQLGTTSVQGAIEALDSRLGGLTVRLDAAEPQADAVGTRVDTLDAAGKALADRVTAEEAATATINSQLAELASLRARLTALEAKDVAVTAALDAQQAAVVDHDTRLTALAATDVAMTTCPPDTFRVGTTCIEAQPRSETFYDSASLVCAKVGGRLCFPHEFGAACDLPVSVYTVGINEYTAIIAETGPRLVSTNVNACFTYNDPIQGPGDHGIYAFRCCYDRLNLTPPPAPTP